ncbi:unnamed protein product [Penicillium glandicola]
MSSAFSAFDTPSAPLNNFIRTWSDSSSKPFNLVTVTSIETETVYPTWVYTISVSGPGSSTTTVLDFLSSTLNPTPVTVTLATTKLSTTEQDTTITAPAISESPTSTLTTTTTVLSSPMGDFPISTESSDHHSWHSDSPSTMPILPVPLTSSSISETTTSSVSSTSSITQANNSNPTSTSKIGTIVGSIIGGSAITIFALLACALYMRRRRRKIATERLDISQRLIRGDSTSSSISHHTHHRYPSYPPIPGNIGPRSPTLPVIPLQFQSQPSNPDLSLDSMYLRGETISQDPFADPPSAVIEISAPSRTASIYSTSSRNTGRSVQGYWDCERQSADTLAVPHGYVDTPMMRDSMRSDPFDLDLEPPPNAHHRSSVPPVPSTWGARF